MSLAYLVSGQGVITLYFGGKVYSVNTDHQNYAQIKSAVSAKQEEGLYELLNPVVKLERVVKSHPQATDLIRFEGGQVLYDNEPVHNTVVDKILQFAREQFDFTNLLNFLKKLPHVSSKTIDHLYRFLEFNNHPITEDGCFLAYKRVNDNYTDQRTGRMDNSVGKVVTMPRWKVEDDPNVTCAAGLHVASLAYARDNLANLGGNRVVVCKVDPADVVSVPTDYNNAKMRVCKYEVIQDYTHELKQEEFAGRVASPVVADMESSSGSYAGLDEDEDCFDENCTGCANCEGDDEDDALCDDCGYYVDDCLCDEDDDDIATSNYRGW